MIGALVTAVAHPDHLTRRDKLIGTFSHAKMKTVVERELSMTDQKEKTCES